MSVKAVWWNAGVEKNNLLVWRWGRCRDGDKLQNAFGKFGLDREEGGRMMKDQDFFVTGFFVVVVRIKTGET